MITGTSIALVTRHFSHYIVTLCVSALSNFMWKTEFEKWLLPKRHKKQKMTPLYYAPQLLKLEEEAPTVSQLQQ